MNAEARNKLFAGVYTVAATNETEFRAAHGALSKELELNLATN